MNSIFPFTASLPDTQEKKTEQLPVFRELAYDFENNRLLRRGGRPYLVEKDEALQIWIYKALLAKRFVWPAYTHAYGSELDEVVGFSNSEEITESEAKRYITEALMVCPYIQELSDFLFTHEGSRLLVGFSVTTIYGRFYHESEIYNE